MSNSRSFRRRLAASRESRPRFPYGGPSLSSVRRWMRQMEAEGLVEQGAERTGKPGRPAHTWTLTRTGKRQARERDYTAPQLIDMIGRALRERKLKQVPLLLRLLAAKDPEQAKRVSESLAALVSAEAGT